jgi:acyl carrier protein
VSENLGVSIDMVTPNAAFGLDLGASLDFVEMIMECEEKFQITIPDEDASKLITVAQLALYIAVRTRLDETVWPPPPQ